LIEVNPGQMFTYSYQIPTDEPAGLYWDHPHYDPLVDSRIAGGAAERSSSRASSTTTWPRYLSGLS
jgi:hypothetical protein